MVLDHILSTLTSDNCPNNHRFYRHTINDLRQQQIKDDIMQSVEPQIRALEGNLVNRETLTSIRAQQSSDSALFDTAGGYMDFLTDDRLQKFPHLCWTIKMFMVSD